MSTYTRCIAIVGSLWDLLWNRDHATGTNRLGTQELSVAIDDDGTPGIYIEHERIAGTAKDHGAVANEAAMLALHTAGGDALETLYPRYVSPGDSCARADDPGWRWYCITNHGQALADWERRPLSGALAAIAVTGIADVPGLPAALDGKQPALSNAAVVAQLTDTGGALAYRGAVIGGGGSSTALESLIVALAPVAWYRADAGALDAAGDACTDGVAIATWQDQSGHGYHLAQATAGLRPTLETSVRNGLPVVRYDGIDDYLIASAFPSIDLTNVTVFAVFQQRGATATRTVFVLGASGAGGGLGSAVRIYADTAGPSAVWGAVAKETVAILPGSTATPWGVWTHRVIGSAVTAGRNGTDSSTETGASMSSSLTGLLLGGYWDSGVALPTGDLDVAEMVVIPQGMPDAMLAVLASLLRAKWGI